MLQIHGLCWLPCSGVGAGNINRHDVLVGLFIILLLHGIHLFPGIRFARRSAGLGFCRSPGSLSPVFSQAPSPTAAAASNAVKRCVGSK